MLLQGWKNLQNQIVGTTRFSAHTIAIPHGTSQPDLIHHQLQLEHLLVQALGQGDPRQTAAQQQGQPQPL